MGSTGATMFRIRKTGSSTDDAPAPAAWRVAVHRTGSAWTTSAAAGEATAPLGHLLLGLAACVSDAVRTSPIGRREEIEDVEVALEASPEPTGELGSVVGTIRIDPGVSLSEGDATALIEDAVKGSLLAGALRPAIELSLATD